MSSKHKLRLEANISNRIVHSKKGLSTKSKITCLHISQQRPRHVPRKQKHHGRLKIYYSITFCSHWNSRVLYKYIIYVTKIIYYLWTNPGQQASGVFLFLSSSPSAPGVPCSTPSSNVRLLLWPVKYKNILVSSTW